mmetsp:Transcript_54586/g.63016  ORF Transcript_54586/g.63016 Transcript_54586/m.63016 type:complete len:278 (+) Transcript_54586:104-937(+)
MMNNINSNYSLPFICFFAVSLVVIGDAFSVNNKRQLQLQHMCPRSCNSYNNNMLLFMSEEQEETIASSSGHDNKDNENEVKEAEEEKPEDPPELKDLKEKIAELESTLVAKKSSLQYNLEQCEEFSKSGYTRKVAEMENMKRVRSNIASTSQSSATAAVLRDFLPMYDTFNTLKDTYADDEFGAKSSILNLQQTFENLGVTPYNTVPGEKINTFRMKVLESEVSTEQPKDTVLREVAAGLELDGNVVRPVSCIGSSGLAEDENGEETDDEPTDDGNE